MRPGAARNGDFVYTKLKDNGERVYRIVRVLIDTVVHPGTTNESFKVVYGNLEGTTVFYASHTDCESNFEAVRSKLVLEICEQMDLLRKQLTALGVHSNEGSNWRGL